ncbi:hypothetical protein GCM10011579_054170 [Streptomyces albiflavescens]|uniref:Uncharacterized protein n=1 Tax=Streptomyces albiflavescens TaxID=1623582 RepID=A0A917Y8X8_9ACTN|nr:hypothetical protein GCM10011579_054170 [Streptomyces albiflavescens]
MGADFGSQTAPISPPPRPLEHPSERHAARRSAEDCLGDILPELLATAHFVESDLRVAARFTRFATYRRTVFGRRRHRIGASANESRRIDGSALNGHGLQVMASTVVHGMRVRAYSSRQAHRSNTTDHRTDTGGNQ